MKGFLKNGLIVLLMLIPGLSIAQISDDVFMTKAQELSEQDYNEQALKTWLQAKKTLEVPSTKIGIAFIELVTRKKLSEYNEIASLMYNWGLSAESVSPNSKALKEELDRLRVLVDDDTYKHWRDLLEKNDPGLYREITQFWKQKDPTPTTDYNERLIEHWTRLAFSRAHFSNKENDLSEIDDRAKIYIKYGKPDKTTGSAEIFEKDSDLYAMQEQEPEVIVGNERLDQRKAQLKKQNSRYKIWIYKSSALHEKLIYIFSKPGVGSYGYNLSNSMGTIFGANPSPNALKAFYQELQLIDPFFSTRLSELEFRTSEDLNPNNSVSPWIGSQLMQQAKSELKGPKLRAPDEISTDTRQMQDIPLEVYQYRLLDEQNQPYFATFVESNPHGAFWFDYFSNYTNDKKEIRKEDVRKDRKLKYYDYSQAIQLYNTNGQQITQLYDRPMIAVAENDVSLSLFTVPAVAKGARQVFETQLKNTDPNSSYAVKGLAFAPELRGLSTKTIAQPAPLNNDESQLQMGDLIVGYNYIDSVANRNALPFKVANNRKIPAGEEMVLHLEIYHLDKNANGIYDVTLGYQVIPDDKGILSWFKKQEETFKLTLNFESGTPRFVENLRIKTRDLKPGSYTVQMVASDPQRQQNVEREFEFEVVEKSTD